MPAATTDVDNRRCPRPWALGPVRPVRVAPTWRSSTASSPPRAVDAHKSCDASLSRYVVTVTRHRLLVAGHIVERLEPGPIGVIGLDRPLPFVRVGWRRLDVVVVTMRRGPPTGPDGGLAAVDGARLPR
jgi:hypothetical protein